MKSIRSVVERALLIVFASVTILTSVVEAQISDTVLTVPSNPIWTYTGITLQSSDTVTVHDATGSWTFATNSGFYGPEGLHAPQADSSLFITNGQIGQLIGFIGENPYGVAQNDPRLFAIGSGSVSLTGRTGKLWLGMNDDYTNQIGGASDNAGSLSVTVGSKKQSDFTVSFSAFIPGNYVSASPNFCLREPRSGPSHSFLFAAADDRWFDPSANTYRVRQVVTVIPDQTIDPDGLKEGTAQTTSHDTKLYADDALPVIDQSDDDAPNDCQLLHAIDTPVLDGVQIIVLRIGPNQVRVHLRGNAGTGAAFGLGHWCNISWDATLEINTAGPRPTVVFQGSHDKFPAYEIYVNNQAIYTHSPGLPPYGKWDLFSLCGRMDVFIPRSFVIIN